MNALGATEILDITISQFLTINSLQYDTDITIDDIKYITAQRSKLFTYIYSVSRVL